MKIKDNSLFEFLDYVFKVSDTPPKNYKVPVFLVNRWVSMSNPAFAMIVNLTTNKWCGVNKEFDVTKFYRYLLPRYTKNTKYIKKQVSEKEEEEDCQIASVMECSQREINLFKETLAQLNISSK